MGQNFNLKIEKKINITWQIDTASMVDYAMCDVPINAEFLALVTHVIKKESLTCN